MKKAKMKQFLVGLRCSEWKNGNCGCTEDTDQATKDLIKTRFNCIYEDACFYAAVTAKDADSLNMFMIMKQVGEALLAGAEWNDYYIVSEVVPNLQH